MTVDVSFEAQARWEIWQSFDSLLRCYAAAAALDGSESIKVELGGDGISAVVKHASLVVTLNPIDGIGHWHYRGAAGSNSGRFALTLDGAMSFDGSSKDLDHAAIDFVAMFRRDAERIMVKQQ